MAGFWLSRDDPRNSQPQEATPVRADTNLRILGAWSFSELLPVNSAGISGAATTTHTDISLQPGSEGRGLRYGPTSAVSSCVALMSGPAINFGQADAWIAVRLRLRAGYYPNGSALNAIIGLMSVSVDSLTAGVTLYFDSANCLVASWPTYPGVYSTALSPGGSYTALIRRVGAAYELWLDGKLIGTGSAGTVSTSPTLALVVGADPYSYFRQLPETDVLGAAVGLGAVAAQEVSADFWGSIWAPERRDIWVPGAGSSLPTLSAATAIDVTSSGFRPRVTATWA